MEAIKNECEELVNLLYADYQPKLEKLVFLGLVDENFIKQEEFLNQMITLHQEIRLASTNRFRYFVNMKLGKLVANIKSSLPLSEYLDMVGQDVCYNYWNTVHHLYALLESVCEDKNEAYINTLVSEINRRDKVKALEEAEIAERQRKMAENAEKHLSLKEERTNVDDFLDQLESNPEMMEAVASMTGQNMSISDMKKALNANPQMINMIKGAMSMVNGNDEVDLKEMLSQFIPDIDMNCQTNIVLVNKIYNDLLYIFETETPRERIIEKATIYKDLISNNRITLSEVLACAWKIANDEEKFTTIQNISTEHITMDMVMSIVLEFIPSDMLDKFGDIDAIKNMIAGAGGDMGGMGDIMKMFQGKMKPDIDEQLTEEQMKELEDFYNSMNK